MTHSNIRPIRNRNQKSEIKNYKINDMNFLAVPVPDIMIISNKKCFFNLHLLKQYMSHNLCGMIYADVPWRWSFWLVSGKSSEANWPSQVKNMNRGIANEKILRDRFETFQRLRCRLPRDILISLSKLELLMLWPLSLLIIVACDIFIAIFWNESFFHFQHSYNHVSKKGGTS